MRITRILAAATLVIFMASGPAWALDGAGQGRGRVPGLRKGQHGQRHGGKNKGRKDQRLDRASAGAMRGKAALRAMPGRLGLRAGRSGMRGMMARNRARMMQGRMPMRQIRGMAGRCRGHEQPGIQAGRGQRLRHLGEYFQKGRSGQGRGPGMRSGGPGPMRKGLGRQSGDRAGDARKKIEEFLKNRRKAMEKGQRRGR